MDDGDAIVIDPKDAFGTVLRFTEGSIPNDPR
jgi:hypothetical protein